MNSKVPNSLEDKENINFIGKSRDSGINNRSFGTDITRQPLQPIDIDSEDAQNPQRLGDYAKEIFAYLYSSEDQFIPQYGYMKSQIDITEKMRAMLIDWLVEVHHKFRLIPETLFLAVNLIDRYLEKEPIQRNRLQLVGVTAMLIATKYEETCPPEVKDFVYITDKSFTREEIIEMEAKMLRVLEFNIISASPLRFLERYQRVSNMNERSYNMARYLIELPIIEYKMIRHKPSMIAASAVYLTNKILNNELVWPQSLLDNSPYKENDLKPCARDICALLQGAEKCSLQAIKKKYSQPKYSEVAKIVVMSQSNR